MKSKRTLLFLPLCFMLGSCATYYQKNIRFHKLFLSQKLAEADHLLAKGNQAKRKNTRLLYYLNRGITTHLMSDYEASNAFLEQAYLIHEDLVTQPLEEALQYLINPTITAYQGEEHELLLLHYYKAINFLQLSKLQEALIEVRRLNIKLNLLSDKYPKANKFRRDAFMYNLMGLIYQANLDYNNAFIAYRNAVEVYQEDYKPLFGLSVPQQLQKDIIYTAYKTGLYDQANDYKKTFQLDYNPALEPEGGDMICLWHNGLGPFKAAWSIDFLILPGTGSIVNFVNQDLGLFFPFPLPNHDSSKQNLAEFQLIRVAFPKYIERPLRYDQAMVQAHGHSYSLEIGEDINAISFHLLHQRMIRELSQSLLRLALKKLAEYQVGKYNKLAGAVLGLVNLATEKADTRNWQTIPHSIYYTRIKLPVGKHHLQFKAYASQAPHINQSHTWDVAIHAQQTIFLTISSLAQAIQ